MRPKSSSWISNPNQIQHHYIAWEMEAGLIKQTNKRKTHNWLETPSLEYCSYYWYSVYYYFSLPCCHDTDSKLTKAIINGNMKSAILSCTSAAHEIRYQRIFTCCSCPLSMQNQLINNIVEGHVRGVWEHNGNGRRFMTDWACHGKAINSSPPTFSSVHSLAELLMMLVRYRGLGWRCFNPLAAKQELWHSDRKKDTCSIYRYVKYKAGVK